jgi:membrane-bound lytic murein transglycosylase MltF
VRTEWIQAKLILPMKALYRYLAQAAKNYTLGEDIYNYIANMRRF